MCWMLYMASDVVIPLTPWNAEHPDFYVEQLEDWQEVVRHYFSLPHVAYMGSHEGCGCGFHYYEELPDSEQAGELESIEKLAQATRSIQQRDGKVELFLCWEGDEKLEPTDWIDLTTAEFGAHEFPMELRQAARVLAATTV